MATILLVEDEPIIALAETKTLEGFGYHVITSRTGEAAIASACVGPVDIDLILMDIDLGPGIDGPEAARQILAQKNLPIVFLTSHAERETVEKVRGITRYGYVIKNSGNFVLQTSIEMAFELFQAHNDRRGGEARLSALLKTIPDLVWLKDGKGIYLACNSEFERLFGASEEEIVGKTDYDFLTKEEADFFRSMDKEAIAFGKPHSNEEWITYANDGHRALLETIKTPMIDSLGKLIGVLGIGRDITERKRSEDRLKESEARVQRKLAAIEKPEGDLDELGLMDILDIDALRSLLEDFSGLTGMVTAMLDTEGRILIATGWQDACTQFHRSCAASSAACTESDLHLSAKLKEGEFAEYRCGNNLWDLVTPLYIESRHVGNIFSGQFFYEDDVLDEAFFRAQAERFGFEVEAYLGAIRKVPRYSHQRIRTLMDFLVRLTHFVSRLSYSNLHLARAMAERQSAQESLSRSMEEKELLFKELQHRVKNSLNIVSSLLSLNMEALEEGRSRKVFQEAIDRVSAVSMIYDKLSTQANNGRIDLGVYLGDLAELLQSTYTLHAKSLDISLDLESLDCDIKRAVSIGLIFNELLTNALKYAGRPGKKGSIRIRLSKAGTRATLVLADDGPGLAPGFDLKTVKSLGLRIVSLLAGEIGGDLSLEGAKGTVATLGFEA